MQTVSNSFLTALRQPHSVVVTVDAWRGGSKVASDLPVEGGEVTVDSGSRVRRILNVALAPDPGLWDTLSPVGTELVVRRGIRYPSGEVETVPLGTFGIDAQRMNYSPAGRLQITAPDRWAKVQRAKFETPNTEVAGQSIRAEMGRYISEASGAIVNVTATTPWLVRPTTWERDRDDALKQMGEHISAEAFFTADGTGLVRDVPTLAQPSVWLVDASATGVMLSADRERNRQRTYNVVIVTSEAVDGQVPFAPVVVEDTDPSSPTWIGGPFLRVPEFHTSSQLRTTQEAQAAGRTILDRVRGLAAQLTLESVVNPALDAGDVIDVLLPAERRDLPRPVEKHLIDSLTIPLPVDGAQRITTRSTRPDS